MTAARAHHEPGGGAGAQLGALEIGVDHDIPVVGGLFEKQPVAGDSGVVDEEIDSLLCLKKGVDGR